MSEMDRRSLFLASAATALTAAASTKAAAKVAGAATGAGL